MHVFIWKPTYIDYIAFIFRMKYIFPQQHAILERGRGNSWPLYKCLPLQVVWYILSKLHLWAKSEISQQTKAFWKHFNDLPAAVLETIKVLKKCNRCRKSKVIDKFHNDISAWWTFELFPTNKFALNHETLGRGRIMNAYVHFSSG